MSDYNMKHFKSYIFALLIILMCAPATVAANRKGDTSLGPKLGYISKNKSVLAGLVFQYSFTDYLRISPELSCDFRRDNLDAFILDVNMHAPLNFTGDKVDLYPLAGLTFNSWGKHWSDTARETSDDVTSHVNRWGLNLGAGMDLRCNQTLKLSIEARYSLVKAYSNFQLTLGIAYVF